VCQPLCNEMLLDVIGVAHRERVATSAQGDDWYAGGQGSMKVIAEFGD